MLRLDAGLCGGAPAALLLLAATVAAPPGPVPLSWSTYLRSGPSESAAAVAELEHDAAVSVVSCDARWCRVAAGDAKGYVDRDALDLPRTLAPRPPARTDCLVTGQEDNRGPIPTRFCSAAARPAAPR